jgi:hypothetical protein
MKKTFYYTLLFLFLFIGLSIQAMQHHTDKERQNCTRPSEVLRQEKLKRFFLQNSQQNITHKLLYKSLISNQPIAPICSSSAERLELFFNTDYAYLLDEKFLEWKKINEK